MTFGEGQMQTFAELVHDRAPVHWDVSAAQDLGFRGRLVYGFLVAAGFSGILGMKLPGPYTVIHSVKFDMVGPVLVGERISYRVRVTHITPALKTVVLELRATRDNGDLVLRGSAQCGFRQ